MDFSEPVSFVSADVSSATGQTVTMSLFDSADTLLTSAISGSLTNGIFEGLSVSAGGIAYIVFEASSNFAASPSIDNLTFGVPAVPLPATMPLLGAGLGGFAMMRRKRKTTA